MTLFLPLPYKLCRIPCPYFKRRNILCHNRRSANYCTFANGNRLAYHGISTYVCFLLDDYFPSGVVTTFFTVNFHEVGYDDTSGGQRHPFLDDDIFRVVGINNDTFTYKGFLWVKDPPPPIYKPLNASLLQASANVPDVRRQVYANVIIS